MKRPQTFDRAIKRITDRSIEESLVAIGQALEERFGPIDTLMRRDIPPEELDRPRFFPSRISQQRRDAAASRLITDRGGIDGTVRPSDRIGP